MTVAQQRARLLWLEGAAVADIAATLQITTGKVYRWRATLDWPKRPDPRLGKMRPVVALAAALWQDDVTRSTIAALCQVTIKSIDTWKVKYGWRHRSPGLRASPPAISAPLIRRAQRLASADAATALPTPTRPLPRWSCCDQRLGVPVCPRCQRPHPLLPT